MIFKDHKGDLHNYGGSLKDWLLLALLITAATAVLFVSAVYVIDKYNNKPRIEDKTHTYDSTSNQ